MFILTDQVISAAIDNISGFIISEVTSKTGKSMEEITEAFLSSETYMLLSDPETGYYWDNIFELIEMFMIEIKNDTVE